MGFGLEYTINAISQIIESETKGKESGEKR